MRATLDPRYVAMAHKIAHGFVRRLPRSVEADDVRQAALLGLLDAVRRHPDGEGAQYEWYLRCRIRGSIIDELRAEDWLPRRGRARAATSHLQIVRLDDMRTRSGRDFELVDETPWEPEEDLDHEQLMAAVWSTPMTEREQRMMRACFGDRRRRHIDVAADEGVSEARISQIVGRVVERMRRHVGEGARGDAQQRGDEPLGCTSPGPGEASTGRP